MTTSTPLADPQNVSLRDIAVLGDITKDQDWLDLLGLSADQFAAITTAGAARKLTGEALHAFNEKHPRGFGGRFGDKTGPVSGARSAVEAGDFRGLKRVGGQLGSNPAALFEDERGQKWYVKAQKTPLHAANEAVASALYRKLYVTTPEVFTGSGAPGLGDGPQTASEWMDVDEPDFGDPIFRRDTHGDFGAHAWLANWDVAGMGMDNIRVEKGSNFPVEVDVGGSLLFRAQGGEKGELFGGVVTEFDTLRDGRYAPQGSRLFADMSVEELAASAEHVEKITPSQIRATVAEYHMPDELADRLITRRADLIRRAELLRLEAEVQPDPDRRSGRAALEAAGARLSDKPPGQTYDTAAELVFKRDPGWSPQMAAAKERVLRFYRNGTFSKINAYQRGDEPDGNLPIRETDERGHNITQGLTEHVSEHIAHMWDVFDHSQLDSPVELWRGIFNGEKSFPDVWRDGDMTGVEWTEAAPLSTSANERTGRSFGGDVVMRLHVPAGVGAVQLSGWPTQEAPNREAELLLQPGLRMRVVGDRTEVREFATGHKASTRIWDVVVEAVPDEQ
jgi:ADP-ribosyltransferase exoenzyme